MALSISSSSSTTSIYRSFSLLKHQLPRPANLLRFQPTTTTRLPALTTPARHLSLTARNRLAAQPQPISTNHTTRSSSDITATMSAAKTLSADALLELVRNRRTYYPLSPEVSISQERITEIVSEALKWVPSSFNSQSTRAVILFGEEHHKLWDLTTGVLKSIVPEESWQPTADKMAMFRGAAGTVMFFEDQAVVDAMSAKFATYADKFPVWATQSDAMLQFTIWTALEAEGLGANLQHYNPIIDEKVAAEWKTPATWKLNAQLVFGGRTGETYPKDFKPIEERLKVYSS